MKKSPLTECWWRNEPLLIDYVKNRGKSGSTLIASAKKRGEWIVSGKYYARQEKGVESESFLINYPKCTPGLPYAFFFFFFFTIAASQREVTHPPIIKRKSWIPCNLLWSSRKIPLPFIFLCTDSFIHFFWVHLPVLFSTDIYITFTFIPQNRQHCHLQDWCRTCCILVRCWKWPRRTVLSLCMRVIMLCMMVVLVSNESDMQITCNSNYW